MSTELATTSGGSIIPEYLKTDLGLGMENLEQYVQPPYLAIVQGLTPEPARSLGPVGTIYLTPTMQKVWSPAWPAAGRPSADLPIQVIPLFMWTEYTAWNPREVAGLSKIRERSFDKTSALGRQATAFKMEDRTYDCPEATKIAGKPTPQVRCQEHINFVLMLWCDGDLNGMEAKLSFATTGLKEGRQFCTTLKSAGKQLPIWSQVFSIQGIEKKNTKGTWGGWDIRRVINAADSSIAITDEAMFTHTTERYVHYRDQYAAGLLLGEETDELTDGVADNGATTAPASNVAM